MEKLVRKYYPDILRYCLWHAPDRNQAEDATQETFLKAIRYSATKNFSGNFKSFLYKIAANTCIDMKRQKWNSFLSIESMESKESTESIDEKLASTDKQFERIENKEFLRSIVKNLPEDEKEIILLRFGQDLKLREIAEITNFPMRTVQTKLKSALKKIKQNWR